MNEERAHAPKGVGGQIHSRMKSSTGAATASIGQSVATSAKPTTSDLIPQCFKRAAIL